MKKAWIIARHEFLVTVKRVWFIIAAVVFPLFMLALFGVMGFVAHDAKQQRDTSLRSKPLGLVDRWGGLSSDPEGFDILRFSNPEEAEAALKGGRVHSFVVVEPDYLDSGAITLVTTRRPSPMTIEGHGLPPGFDSWMVENVLKNVDEGLVARAKVPARVRPDYRNAQGLPTEEDMGLIFGRWVMAYGFFLLLFISIFTSSQYLLQGMAEEKEHRVMEIVLTSVKPDELMLGKLVGLGAAGLLQVAIWAGMFLAFLGMFKISGSVAAALGGNIRFDLEPASFLLCLIFFLLGYILYGSLMLGFGALGTNLRESQQMASVWSLIGTSPVIIVVALFEAPQGPLARVFSLIPFTSPTTMIFRYTVDPEGTPLYDIVAAVLLLAGSTWLIVKFSARLFRAGLLLYGKRPGLREIWRWLFASS